MKLIYSLLLLSLSFISFGQDLNPFTTSQGLQDEIAKYPEEYHEVIFLFADRVDALAMNEDFYARKLTLSQRNIELFVALKAKANNVQAPYLKAFQASNQVKNIRPFWISNIIYAEVKGDYLAELSHDTAIDYIDLNVPLTLDSYTSSPALLAPTPNNAELGLRMINADSMWAIGYTGYGRTVLISDTGVDGYHPALSDKFRGNCTSIEQAWYDTETDYPIDSGDHGTHVTGIVLGLDRTTNDTIGVAFNAQWLAVPSVAGTISTIVAFQWALDPDNNPSTTDDMPDAINNSWSDFFTGSCSEIYSSILNTIEATKIAVVFSAGNEGPEASSMPAPKNINTSLVNTFTTGSINNSFDISYSSGRGPSICSGEGALSIKPEVSAPGQNVRSSRPNGTYGLNSGTSMAAPHVSGAILLLREAFPNTTGTEVKMALYMSATDLGDIGEDNTFGMGLINLPAAYDYLIAQGHIPIPPLSMERDIIALDLEVSPISCPELFQFNISFENAGVESLSELTIEYNLGSFSETYQWTGNLLPDEVTSVFIEDSNVPIGDYQLEVILKNPNGLLDERSLNNKILKELSINDTSPLVAYAEGGLNEYCDASEIHLRVDYQGIGNIEVQWFDQISGGNSIGSGSVLNVGALEETQTFFAGCNYLWPAGKTTLGPINSFPEVTNPGIQFDALQDLTLQSVLVYFEAPGARLISLEDSNGVELDSKFVNVVGDGQKRILLGFDIAQGNDYRLKLKQGQGLLSDSEDVQFPYILDDVIRLNNSLAETNEQSLTKYHCFYDWKVEIPSTCGRTPVIVDIVAGDNIPTADFTSSQTEINLDDGEAIIDFTNASDGAASFLWNFGDGMTDDSNESPMHTFTELGTYVVSLTVFNADGCSDTHFTEITVTDDVVSSNNNITAPLWDISLFPNPTQDKVTINFALGEAQNISYRVVDLYGRTITATSPQNIGTAQVSLDMSDVSSGIYYLIFENNTQQRMVRKLVKM